MGIYIFKKSFGEIIICLVDASAYLSFWELYTVTLFGTLLHLRTLHPCMYKEVGS